MTGNCPDSTIATSDVTAEGANDVTMESTEMEGSHKEDSVAVCEEEGKLSLHMSLTTPVTEESGSLPFSLESKRHKAGMVRPGASALVLPACLPPSHPPSLPSVAGD